MKQFVVIAALVTLLFAPAAFSQEKVSSDSMIEMLRSDIRTEKRTLIEKAMKFTDKEAAAFFLKAAKLGDFDATYQMGMMYLEGRGVAHDDEQACYWIRKAAEMGDRDAQALLGEMLELGHTTPRNLDEAAEWLAKAADWGDEDAQIRLDRLLRSGRARSPHPGQDRPHRP